MAFTPETMIISLRHYERDPMWADHAEVPKSLLKIAADMLEAKARTEAELLTIADYEQSFEGHRALVRHIDVAMNGAGAARQASLCDLIPQIEELAALRRPMTPQHNDDTQGWRTIDSAPKDGTFILCTAGYREGNHPWGPAGWITIGRWIHDMRGDGHGWHNGAGTGKIYPAYWQPLPPPPKTTRGDDNG